MDELLRLEEAGWRALSSGEAASFYGELLADDAIMVLPFRVMGRQSAIDAMRQAPPWSSYRLEDAGCFP
jgi:hypothetical protein